MADHRPDDLLDLVQAMQDQQAALAAETASLLQRCRREHARKDDGQPAPPAQKNASASEDVEMTGMDAGDAKQSLAAARASSDAHADQPPPSQDGKAPQPQPSSENTFFCRPCYESLLTRIHDVYASPARPQWYAPDKHAFLAQLDRQLDDARHLRGTTLAHIEESIAASKAAWLLAWLQDSATIKALGDILDGHGPSHTTTTTTTATTPTTPTSSATLATLRTRLADPKADLVPLLRDLLARAGDYAPPGSTTSATSARQDAETAVRNLKAAPAATARGAIARDLLFPHGTVPDAPVAQQLARRLLDGSVGLDQGLREALRALSKDLGNTSSTGHTAKIEKHRKRLAELRRAKAAHEAQKMKRMKPPEVPYFLQDNDTACATCGHATSPQKSPFCIVCFLEVDYCLRENHTVWCSPACMAKTYTQHVAADHACAAGDRCTHRDARPDDARTPARHSFCRECVLSFGISTFYCAQRCAQRDFQRHREKVHLVNRQMRADFHDDQADLAYSNGSDAAGTPSREKTYTAADIGKHVLTIEEAFASLQKKHPDWQLTQTKVEVMVAP